MISYHSVIMHVLYQSACESIIIVCRFPLFCHLHIRRMQLSKTVLTTEIKLKLNRNKSFVQVFFMPSSHRRRGQDKTVLSCPRLRCEM